MIGINVAANVAAVQTPKASSTFQNFTETTATEKPKPLAAMQLIIPAAANDRPVVSAKIVRIIIATVVRNIVEILVDLAPNERRTPMSRFLSAINAAIK